MCILRKDIQYSKTVKLKADKREMDEYMKHFSVQIEKNIKIRERNFTPIYSGIREKSARLKSTLA